MIDPAGRPVIGIAGGIGAGKTTVADVFAELGCVVSRSDVAGRAALRDPRIIEQLVSWWGPSILDADREIDRSRVAAIVFSDARQRRRLEAITHPWIEARRRQLLATADDDAVAFVIDAPLLYETKLDRECDVVVFVESSRATRQERVRRDRGWSEGELPKREDSQMPLDEKRSRADYVVTNDGDLSELRRQVQDVLKQVLAAESRTTTGPDADCGTS
jgi:dephospho-CoA kinase